MEPPPPAVMEITDSPLTGDDPPSAAGALWDWGDLLDFTVDDHFPIFPVDPSTPFLSSPTETETQAPAQPEPEDRVRKRDPRLSCSNFLAGRVPCACPEVDEKLEEQEEGEMPGKKRARVARVAARAARAGSGTSARCQVPGCEADISELKGYHRRHRVCLRCANASSVVVHGEAKRYCQQCGKFHVLSDFDEGKRSCRRKLERHNNRRRRKPPLDSKSSIDKEELQKDDVACDGEARKDNLVEKDVLVECEDGHVSPLHSAPYSQNHNSDSGVSFGASGDTAQTDAGRDDSKFALSPSCCDTKTTYSSMCPTGRISFKLYDWNPAEFPRRLRHQIFQWLASMPVELEGYIRPGCTILTSFVAMPSYMWAKLLEDPVSYLHNLIVVPGKMLSKKGPMVVYLNNIIFHVTKDGSSVMRVDVEGQAPRLHHVHPMCFEAGKPIEFVVCGTNLSQPKSRFLVSFAGKYMPYDYCVALSPDHTGEGSSLDQQLYKICVQQNGPNLCGPAFIEVENESGVSNFIPILIADREICSEMEIIQERFRGCPLSKGSQCESSSLRQKAFSEFIVDVAWLLREPSTESIQQTMTSSQIQRFNSLLSFLLHHESINILNKVLRNLKIMMGNMEVNVVDSNVDADMWLLQKYMHFAGGVISQKLKASEGLSLNSEYVVEGNCSEGDGTHAAPFISEDFQKTSSSNLRMTASSTPNVRSDMIPLLSGEVVMNMNPIKDRPNKSCSLIFSNRIYKPRYTMIAIAIVAVCFGVCAVLLHPNKVSRFAVVIRRCLADAI